MITVVSKDGIYNLSFPDDEVIDEKDDFDKTEEEYLDYQFVYIEVINISEANLFNLAEAIAHDCFINSEDGKLEPITEYITCRVSAGRNNCGYPPKIFCITDCYSVDDIVKSLAEKTNLF